MTRIDGRASALLPATDRGLLYGDGLFETIRFDDDEAALWAAHQERLAAGARRLGIAAPDPSWLYDECRRVLSDAPFRTAASAGDAVVAPAAVVRITLTRGDGAGGYAPPADGPVRCIVAARPLADQRPRRLRVVICATEATVNRSLAGLKHLGRIDQVLAAREVQAADADEGLLFRGDGALVEGVSGNVFLHVDGVWLTPSLDRAGVAGVYRAWLLSRGAASERGLDRALLDQADAVFLTNAVRGMEAVVELAGRRLGTAPVEALRQRLGEPWPRSA